MIRPDYADDDPTPGPVVSPRFTGDRTERAAIRSEYGIADDESLILLTCDSWGVGDVPETVEAIAGSGRFRVITLCGTDQGLQRELERRGLGPALGWTDRVPQLLDLRITVRRVVQHVAFLALRLLLVALFLLRQRLFGRRRRLSSTDRGHWLRARRKGSVIS